MTFLQESCAMQGLFKRRAGTVESGLVEQVELIMSLLVFFSLLDAHLNEFAEDLVLVPVALSRPVGCLLGYNLLVGLFGFKVLG